MSRIYVWKAEEVSTKAETRFVFQSPVEGNAREMKSSTTSQFCSVLSYDYTIISASHISTEDSCEALLSRRRKVSSQLNEREVTLITECHESESV